MLAAPRNRLEAHRNDQGGRDGPGPDASVRFKGDRPSEGADPSSRARKPATRRFRAAQVGVCLLLMVRGITIVRLGSGVLHV